MAAFITVYATYRTYRAPQDKHDSDVLATAAEMLSSTEVSIRLGAIYARAGLRRPRGTTTFLYSIYSQVLFERGTQRAAKALHDAKPGPVVPRCPVDVHAVLSAIGERCWKKNEDANEHHELSCVRLEDAWYVRCDSSRIHFWEAELDSVNFTRADLRDSDFTGARLVDCNFEGALMEAVVLDGAELV